METIGGYVCFLNPDVSNHIKNVLNAWEVFNISRVLLHFEYTDERLSTKVLEEISKLSLPVTMVDLAMGYYHELSTIIGVSVDSVCES